MRRVDGNLKGRPPLGIPLQRILRAIRRHRRVAPAARALGCSDAYVWKRLKQAGITDISVSHASVSEIPAGTRYVVCHRDLAERAENSAPKAKIVTITDFMGAPEYDQVVQEIAAARA